MIMNDCSLPLDRSLPSFLRKYSLNTLRRGIHFLLIMFSCCFIHLVVHKSTISSIDNAFLQIGRHSPQSYSCSQSSDCSPSEVHAHLSQSSHHILNHLQVSTLSKYLSRILLSLFQTSLVSPLPYSPFPSSL